MLMRILSFMILIPAAVHDIRKRELTWSVLAAAGALAIASSATALICGQWSLPELLMSLAPGGALLAMAFLSREGIGYGDGLLTLLIGPAFGWERMTAGILLAFFSSAVISVILLAAKRVGRRSCLPFVPFITLAMGVVSIALR